MQQKRIFSYTCGLFVEDDGLGKLDAAIGWV
jgi:hypothetical protein